MSNRPRIDRIDWLGRVSFEEGLERQEKLVESRLAEETGNTFLLLEHEPVYTIGRTRDKSSLRDAELPHPVLEINRGGQATYHGPGQLVGYAIVDLRSADRDLHAHLRWIEEIVITLCSRVGVEAGRHEGLTGVWVEDRKIASVGVGVRKWITMHGFALNVTKSSLEGFGPIIPCGIEDVTMTSLASETGSAISVEEAAEKCRNLLD